MDTSDKQAKVANSDALDHQKNDQSLAKTDINKGSLVVKTLLGLIVVGFGVIVAVIFYHTATSALVVGGDNISHAQYNTLVQLAKSDDRLSKIDATNQIILSEKKILAAQQLHITISPVDVINAANAKYQTAAIQNKLDQWQQLIANGWAIDDRVQVLKVGGFSGAVYFFPFSRNFKNSKVPTNDPQFLKQSTIATDQSYALQQANSYFQVLSKHTLDQTTALANIRKDAKLVDFEGQNDSNEFTFNVYGSMYLNGSNPETGSSLYYYDPMLVETARLLKVGTFSKVATTNTPYQGAQQIPSSYFIMNLQTIYRANAAIGAQYNAVISKIQVVKHV